MFLWRAPYGLGNYCPRRCPVERPYRKEIENSDTQAEKSQKRQHSINWLEARISKEYDPADNRERNNRLRNNSAPCDDAMVEL